MNKIPVLVLFCKPARPQECQGLKNRGGERRPRHRQAGPERVAVVLTKRCWQRAGPEGSCPGSVPAARVGARRCRVPAWHACSAGEGRWFPPAQRGQHEGGRLVLRQAEQAPYQRHEKYPRADQRGYRVAGQTYDSAAGPDGRGAAACPAHVDFPEGQLHSQALQHWSNEVVISDGCAPDGDQDVGAAGSLDVLDKASRLSRAMPRSLASAPARVRSAATPSGLDETI